VAYAEEVRTALNAAGIRAEVDDRAERMQAKVRDAQQQQVPVMLVVGDRDQEARAVSPRLRTGDKREGVPLEEFVADLASRIAARELWPIAAPEESAS
jgi:threonyl-tRNA synthetase